MTKPYHSVALANTIIRLSRSAKKEITHLKLQKLSYISHGWCLGIYKIPFIDENVLAWKYGPVILSIYEEFKFYGNQPITDYGEIIDSDMEVVEPQVNNDALPFIKSVWDAYGHYTAPQLCNLTHEPETPWHITKIAGHTIIKNAVIQKYYEDLWEKANTS